MNLLPSLENRSDLELIREIKENACSDCFNEICRRYEKVFFKICQKYSPVLQRVGVNIQDIYDEKDCIIYHCVSTFDPSRLSKLSTWIGNYARFLCLNSINDKRFSLAVSEEELTQFENLSSTEEFRDKENSVNSLALVEEILGHVNDERMLKIINLRYFSGDKKMIWSKIAKKLKVSTQTAINLHNRGVEILRKKIQNGVFS